MKKKYSVDEKTGKRVIRNPKRSKFTSAQRKAAGERLNAAKKVTIWLQIAHYRIDGVYGPGNVTVRKDLAAEFAREEQEAQRAEEAFYGTKGVLVVGQRRVGNTVVTVTKQVPVETFDLSLGDDSNIAMNIKG